MKEKISLLQGSPTLEEASALAKETDAKTLVLESLDGRVAAIGSDLETSEREQLQEYLKMLSANQAILSKLAKEVLRRETQAAEEKKKVDEDATAVATWLKAKTSELLSTSDVYDPLRAAALEKKAARLKKAESEVRAYEESDVAKLRKSINALTKRKDSDNGDNNDDLVRELKEIERTFEDFKVKLRTRVSDLEEKIEPRRRFEAELDACCQWLARAEGALAAEMRGTVNIATLDDHLQKFRYSFKSTLCVG